MRKQDLPIDGAIPVIEDRFGSGESGISGIFLDRVSDSLKPEYHGPPY